MHIVTAKHTHNILNIFIYIYKKKGEKRETSTQIHCHTLKATGSDMETIRETAGIETVSLCESCNLFTEGRILCSAREKASNTNSLLMP